MVGCVTQRQRRNTTEYRFLLNGSVRSIGVEWKQDVRRAPAGRCGDEGGAGGRGDKTLGSPVSSFIWRHLIKTVRTADSAVLKFIHLIARPELSAEVAGHHFSFVEFVRHSGY